MQSQRSGVNLGGIWWLAPLSGAPWGGIWCRTRVRVIYTGSKHLFYNVSRILYRNKHKKPLKRIGSSSYYHEVRGGGGIWCKTCVQIEARRIHSKIAVSGDSHITVRTCWIYVVMYIQLIYIISHLTSVHGTSCIRFTITCAIASGLFRVQLTPFSWQTV